MNDSDPLSNNIFTVHTEKSLKSLEVWLSDRRYNNIYPYLKDSRGYRMVGLNYKNEDGTFTREGLIVVKDVDVLDVVSACKEGLCHD